MFDGGIYYMEGTYREIFEAFNLESTLSSNKTTEEDKAKDYDRTSCFQTKHGGLAELQQRWLTLKPEEYAQGDFMGTAIPTSIFYPHHEEYLLDMIDERTGKKVKVTALDRAMRAQYYGKSKYDNKEFFGYLDDNNDVSGIATLATNESDSAKQFWIISVIHNATGAYDNSDPSRTARRVGVFMHFPNGWSKFACNETACRKLNPIKLSSGIVGQTSFQQKFEESLNSEQLYALYENLIKPDGTLDLTFFTIEKFITHGCKRNGLEMILPSIAETKKNQQNTVTPTATPVAPKPNANVTAFIQEPVTANYINQALSPIHYELSEKRTALINKTDNHHIHIRDDGAMQTDPISTSTTPHAAQVILSDFIAMLRTYSVIFREEGAENFPSDKMNLTLAQKPGASETQKITFIRLEAATLKGLEEEIKKNKAHYPDEFLTKITFNEKPLGANPKKRQAEETSTEESDKTEETSPKRLRMGRGSSQD